MEAYDSVPAASYGRFKPYELELESYLAEDVENETIRASPLLETSARAEVCPWLGASEASEAAGSLCVSMLLRGARIQI